MHTLLEYCCLEPLLAVLTGRQACPCKLSGVQVQAMTV